MEKIFELVKGYDLETLVIALLVNIGVGIIKTPIKAWARKLKDSTKITRFIVFLPIILGFLFSFCYSYFIQGTYSFNKEFCILWLTSSSLSLTLYAIFEKMVPSKKKLLNETEIKTNEMLLTAIKEIIEPTLAMKEDEKKEQKEQELKGKSSNKIILRGNSQ